MPQCIICNEELREKDPGIDKWMDDESKISGSFIVREMICENEDCPLNDKQQDIFFEYERIDVDGDEIDVDELEAEFITSSAEQIMPKVHQQKARTDRYRIGANIPDKKTKTGFRLDKSQPGENDELFCKKGDMYYWWKFRYGGKRFSTSYPHRSQLTQSGFLSQMYALMDGDVQNVAYDNIADQIECIKNECEEMRDACQESLDNIPESLQYAPTGELLQTRIEAMEANINNLEMLDPEGWESELEAMEDETEIENFKEEKVQEVIESIEECE